MSAQVIDYKKVGHRRSDYVAKKVNLPLNMDLHAHRVSFGFSKTLQKDKKYCMRLEAITPKSSMGFGSNSKESRTMYVLAGSLIVSYIDKEGLTQSIIVQENSSFVAEAGLIHGYGSDHNPVSIIIVEGGDYNKNYIEINPPSISKEDISVQFAPSKANPLDKIPRVDGTKAKLAAEEEAKRRAKLDGSDISSKVVNPIDVLSNPNAGGFGTARPMGPGGFSD